MLRIDYRMPLGLTMRPAARIIKDLPPLTNFVAYRVLFSSAPSSVKSFYRAEYGRCGGEKKPLEQTPVETHDACGVMAPQSGSESDLTAFFAQVSTPCKRILQQTTMQVSTRSLTFEPPQTGHAYGADH